MMRAGIFGPSLCGKTTLARALSHEYWTRKRVRSLVLDPNNEAWGAHAVVFTDEEKFWDTVWASHDCLVIVEESSETINRNKDLIGVFTRLRHLNHRLIIVGHSGASLLPVMRQQMDTLYLFRQGKKAASVWVEEAMEEKLEQSTTLKQYEFLHYERFRDVKKMKLTLS